MRATLSNPFFCLCAAALALLLTSAPALAKPKLPNTKKLSALVVEGVKKNTVDPPGRLCASKSTNAEVASFNLSSVKVLRQFSAQHGGGITRYPLRLKLTGWCSAWVAGSNRKTIGRFQLTGDFDLFPKKGGKWWLSLIRWHSSTLMVKPVRTAPGGKGGGRTPQSSPSQAISPSGGAAKKKPRRTTRPSAAQTARKQVADRLLAAGAKGLAQQVKDQQRHLVRLSQTVVSDFTFRRVISDKNTQVLGISAKEFAFRLDVDHLAITDEEGRVLVHIRNNRSKSGEERFTSGSLKQGAVLRVGGNRVQQAIDLQQAFTFLSTTPGAGLKTSVVAAIQGPITPGVLLLQNELDGGTLAQLKQVFGLDFLLLGGNRVLSGTPAKKQRGELAKWWWMNGTRLARSGKPFDLKLGGQSWRGRFVRLENGFGGLVISRL